MTHNEKVGVIKSLKAEESEVIAFESHRVVSSEDIDNLHLAFESARVTLNRRLNK